MRHKSVILLFTLVLSLSASSQGYDKLLDNTTWRTGFTLHHAPYKLTWWNSIGDTTIGSDDYVIVENDYPLTPGLAYSVPKRVYLREDTINKQVFFLDSSLTTEVLWYDFGLAVNDSFPGRNFAVLYIDTIQTNWGPKRILVADTTFYLLGLIEGVGWSDGSKDFLAFHYNNFNNWNIHNTGCIYRNRVQVYDFNNWGVPCISMCPSIGLADQVNYGEIGICKNQSLLLKAPCDSTHQWVEASQPTVILSNVDSLRVYPNQLVTKYVWIGSIQTDTVTVKVVDTLILNMGNDTAVCENEIFYITPQVNMPAQFRWMNDHRKDSSSYLASEARDYWVEVADTLFCQSIKDTIIISHLSAPSVSADTVQSISIYDPPKMLSSGSPNGGTYSGSGVIGNTFDPSAAGLGEHLITYIFTNSSGCSDSIVISMTVFDPTVGIEKSTFEQIKIYPNPAKDFFYISGENIVGLHYSITDVTGRIQIEGQITSELERVDVSGLRSGLYNFIVRMAEISANTILVIK